MRLPEVRLREEVLMGFGIVVKNGTEAGRKFPPREQPTAPWVCKQGHQNPGYASTCLGTHCREKRPR